MGHAKQHVTMVNEANQEDIQNTPNKNSSLELLSMSRISND